MSSAIEWLRRLPPHTLRGRLIAWNSLLIVLLFTLLAAIVYLSQARTYADAAQVQVAREAAVAGAALDRQLTPGPPHWPATVALPEIDAYTAPGVTVQVLDATGTVRYTSTAGDAQARLAIPPAQLRSALAGHILTIALPVEGQRTLVTLHPIRAGGAVIGALAVARSQQDTDAALAALRWQLAGALAASLALAVGGTWLVTRRALVPLTQIAQTARTITRSLAAPDAVRSLQLRVPPVDDAGEPGALVGDVNRMLDALAAYDERQRQFIADASHELRTPLTTIRGNLELLRRAPDLDATERAQALDDASAESEGMAVLLNDLLSLARAEAHAQPTPFGPVELDAVLVSAFGVARERARALGLDPDDIRLTDITPCIVAGDAAQLRQVLLILIDNALKYAPGPLLLALCQSGDAAVLMVRDHGPGIAPADLPHLFDRFYRADRARDREGSGLGLAIAHTVVANHGGTLTVTNPRDGGAEFTLRLPLR